MATWRGWVIFYLKNTNIKLEKNCQKQFQDTHWDAFILEKWIHLWARTSRILPRAIPFPLSTWLVKTVTLPTSGLIVGENQQSWIQRWWTRFKEGQVWRCYLCQSKVTGLVQGRCGPAKNLMRALEVKIIEGLT